MDAERSSSDLRNEDDEDGSSQQGPDAAQLPPGDDKTLVEDGNPRENDIVVIEDWSQTGRGFHVEFKDDEHVPIEQGENYDLEKTTYAHKMCRCIPWPRRHGRRS
jgi:hypothetical protein